ncbi:MAG: hypothetical protein EB116_08275 [Betaproteobacteria bacterium]|nr:hypothetical protein [Betaproteobacteria bacterium]
MFGHDIPDSIYSELNTLNRAYINNSSGKPIVSTSIDKDTVAVVIKKLDSEVENLTETERQEMNELNKPFILIGSNKYISEAYLPDRYTEQHSYINRPFWHGVFDCYTLIRDFYRREWGLWLPINIHRPFGWWEQGYNMYVDSAGNHKFIQVKNIQRYDVIVMKLGPVPNHGAIALGNGKVLHHLGGRFSCVEILSPFLKQSVAVVYRNSTVIEKINEIGDHFIEDIDD